MNKLSWMLYLCDFIDALNTLLSIGVTVACIVLGAIIATAAIISMSEENASAISVVWEKTRLSCAVLAALAFISCLIPSEKTFYLIMGSEAGEMVAASEVGQQVISIIKDKISEIESESEK